MDKIEKLKIIADKKLVMRLIEVLKLCDKGEITDEQGINKLMRSTTKYMQKRFAYQEKAE